MFESFFPKPKLFFSSAAIYGLLAMIVWYFYSHQIGDFIGMPLLAEDEKRLVGLKHFATNNIMVYLLYFWSLAFAFFFFWKTYAPHPWQNWSILGSAFIIFTSFIGIQTTVSYNAWYGQFYGLIQTALTTDETVTEGQFYTLILTVLPLAMIIMFWSAGVVFFTKHYIFRWRTAMNDYYTERWAKLRHIEGASQRVQEDTMRFAATMEPVAEAALDSIMTLFAYIPLLAIFSASISSIPILGDIPYSLMWVAIFWPVIGTVLTYLVGIKLPGLEFKNQRVEAAYRKELVLGEDNHDHAGPPELRLLFSNVRKNYFKLFYHYTYFTVARALYNQADTFLFFVLLIPSIAAKSIDFGLYRQISDAFNRVSNSFLYLYRAWPTIIELLSIHKRLKAFEAAIDGDELPKIDQEYLAGKE